jgi:flagellar biosynthesis/type III secretory pathway M-ring protein FliF/YscJ
MTHTGMLTILFIGLVAFVILWLVYRILNRRRSRSCSPSEEAAPEKSNAGKITL